MLQGLGLIAAGVLALVAVLLSKGLASEWVDVSYLEERGRPTSILDPTPVYPYDCLESI
jgi:hypothetical protein